MPTFDEEHQMKIANPCQGPGSAPSHASAQPQPLCTFHNFTTTCPLSAQHAPVLLLRHAADSMNSSRPFTRTANNVFRPAFSYLNNFSRSAQFPEDRNKKSDSYSSHRRKNSASSLDDTDHSDVEQYAQMESSRTSHSSKNSLTELQPAVPLIDISSRSTSPYPRSRSAVQSEDEDDDFEPADSIRPLVSHRDVGRGGNMWRCVGRQGGLGGFFFGTWMGWQIWVGLLVFWVGGCSFGLLLMNRFIMLTGVYK